MNANFMDELDDYQDFLQNIEGADGMPIVTDNLGTVDDLLEPSKTPDPKSSAPINIDKKDEFDDGFDDEEDNDSLEPPDSDSDFDEDDENSEESADSPKNKSDHSKRVMYVFWAICAIILIVFFIISDKSSISTETTVEDTGDVVVEDSDSNTLYFENLDVGQTMYKDYFVISKFIRMENSNLVCYFQGTLESYGQPITVSVDLNTYNSYNTGSRVSVVFYKTLVDNEEKIVVVQVQSSS